MQWNFNRDLLKGVADDWQRLRDVFRFPKTAPREMIGIFPIVSEQPDRLVAGFNDRHLDFRLVVDIATSGATQNVTATTLVLTHNWLGRTYLATIMPFHRLIVRTLLRQVAV